MSKAKVLVPGLRFPEFLGEWEENTLEEVSKYRRGSFPQPYGLPEWYDDENGMPFVQVVDVGNDMKLKPTTKRRISDLACDQSVFIEKGTVIITIQGSIGRVAVTQYNAYIDRTLLLFQRFLKPIDKHFFSYILQNLFYIEKQKAPGGIIKTITKEALSSFTVKLPLITEQQKIADCLSSIDELITAHTQKHEALKTHKKGLMQQLFPVEGETIPKLRFPEFRDAGEWKIKPMEKMFTIGNGKDHKHLPDGDIPVYGSGGYMRSVNEYLYEGESACIGRKGTIDKPVFLSGKFWTVDTLFYTHSFKDCLPKFVYLIFQKVNWRSHNEAGGVPSLSKANINKIEVACPKSAEQLKITDFISSIDELITSQAQKIESLKTHKKGLMQQLFPVVDEVIL